MTEKLTLKDKIESLTSTAEKALALTKKRNESIQSLKQIVEQNNSLVKDFQQRNNKNYVYYRESIISLKNELKQVEDKKENYLKRFETLEKSWNAEYEHYKQKINDHYYLLQKTFNDYVKSKMISESNTYKALEKEMQVANKRIDELEHKILNLFITN